MSFPVEYLWAIFPSAKFSFSVGSSTQSSRRPILSKKSLNAVERSGQHWRASDELRLFDHKASYRSTLELYSSVRYKCSIARWGFAMCVLASTSSLRGNQFKSINSFASSIEFSISDEQQKEGNRCGEMYSRTLVALYLFVRSSKPNRYWQLGAKEKFARAASGVSGKEGWKGDDTQSS